MPLGRIAVVVMGRYPQAGSVKTRVVGVLSPGEAAAVHGIFFRHIVSRIDRLSPAELVVCYEPFEAQDMLRGMLGDCQVTYTNQRGNDPGERLANVLEKVGKRHQRVLVIGVDTPDVPLDSLFSIAEVMEKVPVLVGPRPHGGFWYLGVWSKVEAGALLSNVAWGTGKECRQILENAGALGYARKIGEAWEEVEGPEDLERMLLRLAKSGAGADRELLKELRKQVPGLEDALGVQSKEKYK